MGNLQIQPHLQGEVTQNQTSLNCQYSKLCHACKLRKRKNPATCEKKRKEKKAVAIYCISYATNWQKLHLSTLDKELVTEKPILFPSENTSPLQEIKIQLRETKTLKSLHKLSAKMLSQ